jgi:hypothetical protein
MMKGRFWYFTRCSSVPYNRLQPEATSLTECVSSRSEVGSEWAPNCSGLPFWRNLIGLTSASWAQCKSKMGAGFYFLGLYWEAHKCDEYSFCELHYIIYICIWIIFIWEIIIWRKTVGSVFLWLLYIRCMYVSLDVNVMRVKHLCQFSQQCAITSQDVRACLHLDTG